MDRIDELKRVSIVTIVVTFIGLIGSIASISAFGWAGIVVSLILLVLICIVCYWMLQPVLMKNMRGITILESVRSMGLMDLEIRDDLHHHLPPSEMYKTIKREVLITGVSTYRTFDQHITLLHQTLDAGKRVYVLILNPDVNECPDVLALSAREKKDIRAEILQTITIIKEEKLNQHPGFQIKFMQKMPPFTAIMIDGDASHAGRALDEEGRILVQPGTVYETQHEGIILLFKRISRSTMSPFDYFARDLRKQWQNAKEKSDLIQ